MSQSTHIVGIDPGIVHTGAVSLGFYPRNREVHVAHEAIVGANALAVKAFAAKHLALPKRRFIEGYRSRSAFAQDAQMIKAVGEMQKATGGVVLQNMGVKKVVKRPLMELLGVWQFSTATNHQDLRSAARIALLGMLKDDELNALVTSVVRAHLAGRPWSVIS